MYALLGRLSRKISRALSRVLSVILRTIGCSGVYANLTLII